MARAVRWRVLKAGLALGVAAALAGGAGASARPLTIGQTAGRAQAPAASPARNRDLHATLYGLSCQGRSFCMAIGSYSEPGHPGVHLAEKWNGRKWSTAPDPLAGILNGLTCARPSLCFAARTRMVSGDKYPVTDEVEWDGRTWQTLKNQPPGGVWCVSATVCMTLGGTSFDQWNGSSWQNTGNGCADWGPDCSWNYWSCAGSGCDGQFTFCTDDNCDGIGTLHEIYIGGWDQNASFPGEYTCTGPSFCLATARSTAEVTRNQGQTWQNVSPDLTAVCHGAPNCDLAADLSCGSPGHCMAMNANPVVTLAWNGTAWTAEPLAPVDGHIPQLTAMSCGSASNCMAIGSYKRTRTSFPLTIAEHWNGTAWNITWTLNT